MQIRPLTVAKRQGPGLGLAHSKKTVKLHGGKILAESEVGKVSSFAFTIPIRRPMMEQSDCPAFESV